MMEQYCCDCELRKYCDISPKDCPIAQRNKDVAVANAAITTIKETVQNSVFKIFERIMKAMIKDSGNRTEFTSGAVRDIQEGKGRCDLLPMDAIAEVFEHGEDWENPTMMFNCFSNFIETGEIIALVAAIDTALTEHRMFNDFPTLLLEVSIHFEEGAKKYGERNWEKGIPTQRYIDSAVRHYLKWLRGDDDERHDRAFCWNIICCIWTCYHHPELNDYVKGDDNA